MCVIDINQKHNFPSKLYYMGSDLMRQTFTSAQDPQCIYDKKRFTASIFFLIQKQNKMFIILVFCFTQWTSSTPPPQRCHTENSTASKG